MKKFTKSYKNSNKIPLEKEEHLEFAEFLKRTSKEILEWQERLAHGYKASHRLRKAFNKNGYNLINEAANMADTEWFKEGFSKPECFTPYYGEGWHKPWHY